MKFLKFMSLAAFSALLVACGGKGKVADNEELTDDDPTVEAAEVTLAPMPNMQIEGDNAEYFTITGEDGQSEIKLIGEPDADGKKGTLRATAVIKVYQNKTPDEPMHGMNSFPVLPLYIYNADKEMPGGYFRLTMSKPDEEALGALVKSGKPGEITVNYKEDVSGKDYNEIFGTGAYYTMSGARVITVKEHEENRSASSSSSSSYDGGYVIDDDDDDDSDISTSSSSSSSSNDWDSILNEYESYVNDMISLYKKAQNGDLSAMSDYASVMEDAQSLSNKLANAKGTMSASQVKRYTQILNKMNKALL